MSDERESRRRASILEFAEVFAEEIGCGNICLQRECGGPWRLIWYAPAPSDLRWSIVFAGDTSPQFSRSVQPIREGWDAAMEARAAASELRAEWGGELDCPPHPAA